MKSGARVPRGKRPFVSPSAIGAHYRRQAVETLMDKTVATVTIHKPAAMQKLGHKKLAEWLRQQAAFIEMSGGSISEKYTSRYVEP